jgi:hypothetical protein
MWRPSPLVVKLFSGDVIKVTKGIASAIVAEPKWQVNLRLGRDLMTGKQYSCVECFNNVD